MVASSSEPPTSSFASENSPTQSLWELYGYWEEIKKGAVPIFVFPHSAQIRQIVIGNWGTQKSAMGNNMVFQPVAFGYTQPS